VIRSFDFEPGTILADKYVVLHRLGSGWEGEVYKIRERGTGIERAAKAFYPHRNVNQRAVRFQARKLHKLSKCPVLIHYHTAETVDWEGTPVTLLISDYVEGEQLYQFLNRQRGKRLDCFLGLHLLHALATALESVHELGEYHGDLHTDNIIVRRRGISFDVRLIDFFHQNGSRRENRDADLCELIYLFYIAIGGRRCYRRHPPEIKHICCGLKRSLIVSRFKTVKKLRAHLETMDWS
jgi:tRNA A-37 threonylcarbamoyl transferase component Bud32